MPISHPAQDVVNVAGLEVRLSRAGHGPLLLLLQDNEGNPQWLQYQQALAEYCTVYVPHPPDFGVTPRAAGRQVTPRSIELFGKEVMPAVREW